MSLNKKILKYQSKLNTTVHPSPKYDVYMNKYMYYVSKNNFKNNFNMRGGVVDVGKLYDYITSDAQTRTECSTYNEINQLITQYLENIIGELLNPKNRDKTDITIFTRNIIQNIYQDNKINYKLLSNVNRDAFILYVSPYEKINNRFETNFETLQAKCVDEQLANSAPAPQTIFPTAKEIELQYKCLKEIPTQISDIKQIIDKNNEIYDKDKKRMEEILKKLEVIQKKQQNNTNLIDEWVSYKNIICKEYYKLRNYSIAKGELTDFYYPKVPEEPPVAA